jgi:PadR family transcriptional regulator, regulatory protein PadR
VASRVDVVRGTLELLIMKTLSPGTPLHGFGVLRWISAATEDALLIEEGALYPALHRLEQRGWIRGEWHISEKGRRAKYYELTAVGRRQLVREEEQWTRYLRAWHGIAAAAAATIAAAAPSGATAGGWPGGRPPGSHSGPSAGPHPGPHPGPGTASGPPSGPPPGPRPSPKPGSPPAGPPVPGPART